MSCFEELKFGIDENLETSATYTWASGVGVRVVREVPQDIYPYRIHILRDGKPIAKDDRLQQLAKNINFLHGTIGVTCVMVGLEEE